MRRRTPSSPPYISPTVEGSCSQAATVAKASRLAPSAMARAMYIALAQIAMPATRRPPTSGRARRKSAAAAMSATFIVADSIWRGSPPLAP